MSALSGSSDAGASWFAAARHLPPAYSMASTLNGACGER